MKKKQLSPKQALIAQMIEMYDIKDTKDIQEALKDLLGGTIQSMLESEMDEHLGYSTYERSDNENSRNGKKTKKLRSHSGEIEIEVPQDRDSSFDPVLVPKRTKDISEIENKIIRMYARGMTTRQISEQIRDIYGFDVSESLISSVTNKLLPEIEDWQQRPLSHVYPIVFIDAVHFSVRENNIVKKLAAYVILGINHEGKKEVLTISIGENESSKYWLSLLNELKDREVKDILVLCADGLTGIQDAIGTAFPNTEYQRCIVHQVRNTLKYVSHKDKKEFSSDLKMIYHSSNERKGYEKMQEITQKWNKKYPNSMKSWEVNWDGIAVMFKFSKEVRKVLYTTNAIESLNSTYRRLNSQRSVFPNDTSLLKALYLATFQATKKWSLPVRNWGTIYGELCIMYEGRLPF